MKIESLIGIAAGVATIALAVFAWRKLKTQGSTPQAATAARTYGGYGRAQTQDQIDFANSVPWNL